MGNFYFFRIVTNVWKQELDEYKKYEHGMSQIMVTLTGLNWVKQLPSGSVRVTMSQRLYFDANQIFEFKNLDMILGVLTQHVPTIFISYGEFYKKSFVILFNV